MNVNVYTLSAAIYFLYAFFIQKIKLNRPISILLVAFVLWVTSLSPNYRDVLQLLLLFAVFFMVTYWQDRQVNRSIQASVMPLICVTLVNQFMVVFSFSAFWMRMLVTLVLISILTIMGQWLLNRLYETFPPSKSYVFILSLAVFFYLYYRQLMNVFAYLMVVNDSVLVMFQGVYLLVVVLFIMVIYFFHSSNENIRIVEREKSEQAMNQQYVDLMTQQYDEVRRFRHDYQNVLIGLEGLIKAREWEALANYFEEAWGRFHDQTNDNQQQLGKLIYLQNADLRNLLYTKLLYAQSLGVSYYLELSESILIETTDSMSMPRILGILLDNAIEAAEGVPNGEISIAIINEEAERRMIITNSYGGALPPMHQLRQEGYSTKGQGRGLGLYNLDQLIFESNMMLNTEIHKQVFTQELVIPKGAS